MTRIPGTTPGTATGPAPAEERLRAATKQLEGVFVQELFKAMRETALCTLRLMPSPHGLWRQPTNTP